MIPTQKFNGDSKQAKSGLSKQTDFSPPKGPNMEILINKNGGFIKFMLKSLETP